MNYEIIEKNNISYITLNNDCGLSITLCNIGAAIYDVTFKDHKLVMSPVDLDVFNDDAAYYGKTIGPICGRIKDCIVSFNVKGSDKPKICRLDENDDHNTLHGGHYGYHKHKFKYEIIEEEDNISVLFTFTTTRGHTGLPGIEDIKVIYSLNKNEARLRLETIIKSSDTTVLNPTNHTYWNLNSSGTILDHTLTIPADQYVTYGKQLDPKAIMDVNSVNDWRQGKTILKDISHYSLYLTNALGFDAYYLFENPNDNVHECTLETDKIKMTCTTNRKGVQVYTYNYPTLGRELTNGSTEQKHSGVALEFSENPLTTGIDCVNDAGTSKTFWNEYLFELKD